MSDCPTAHPPGANSLFGILAFPFMPAESGRRGVVVEVAPDWSFDAAILIKEVDVVVWGRMPDGSSPIRVAARRAVARELALHTLYRRTSPRLRIAAIHRLPPRQLGIGGLRHSLRYALRSGVMVELTSLPKKERVLDIVQIAAGVKPTSNAIHAGAGGAVLVRVALTDGSAGLLRLARVGAPGDPVRHVDMLQRLTIAGIALAPRLRGQGRTAGASWTVEELLPGHRPAHATARLAQQVAEVCARFPRAEGSPTALAEDFLNVSQWLPQRSQGFQQLARELAGTVRALPAVLRHGDLWAGNLLVKGEVLTGIIDWDAAHPAAVPGADILQLVATDMRWQAGQSLGPIFLRCPWRSDAFRAATTNYWPRFRVQPGQALLEVIGIAWWMREVCGTLSRFPHRATDERWLATNVDSVLASLGY